MDFKITNKKKVIYSIIIFILLCVALYQNQYSGIINLYGEMKDFQEIIGDSKDEGVLNLDIQRLTEELKILNEAIGGTNIRPDEIQKEIIYFINNSMYEIELERVKKIHQIKKDKYTIYTNQIILKGNYENLIRFLYSLEKNFIKSKLVNVKLFIEKDYTRNIKNLYMSLNFQNYENITQN